MARPTLHAASRDRSDHFASAQRRVKVAAQSQRPVIGHNEWCDDEMDNWLTAVCGILFGFAFLVAGGEFLVRGASRLAAAMRISPLVIGLTVVAFGTSSPELAVSIQSSVAGNADIALGNVVGSNIFNILFVLGLSALIAPLVVASRLIRLDVPLMIGASVLLLVLGLDGHIGRLDGFLMFGILLAYLVWCVRASRRESDAVKAEFAKDQPAAKTGLLGIFLQLGLILLGLLLLGLGSRWLVGGGCLYRARAGRERVNYWVDDHCGWHVPARGRHIDHGGRSWRAGYRRRECRWKQPL